MSERLNDPTFKEYTWTDDVRNTLGPYDPGDSGQNSQPADRGYPKPVYDYPSWSEGQREINGRLQQLFRGNVHDAFGPSMSERFKPGFDPKSLPDSGSAPLTGTGIGKAISRLGIIGLKPFADMAAAEDFLEGALGKQIWDRESQESKEEWWRDNTD